MLRRTSIAMALAGFCGLMFSGCLFHVVDPGPPVEYGYQPLLYNGYVVYYTAPGVPFYWSGGVRVYIPVAYRAHYIDHWRVHRASYLRWHKHRGHHYRSRHYKDDRTRRHDYSPARGRTKPTLKPGRGSSKPTLKPGKGSSKPTLKPKKKEKKEKKKKKKKKKKKATLKPKK